MIEKYFENIVSKIWIGLKSQSNFNMAPSEIKDIFLELSTPEKNIFLGKTEQFYFIVDGIEEDGFHYGILFLNTNLKNLILGYKDRQVFNADNDIDTFVNNLELHYRLSKNLVQKNAKIKTLKI